LAGEIRRRAEGGGPQLDICGSHPVRAASEVSKGCYVDVATFEILAQGEVGVLIPFSGVKAAEKNFVRSKKAGTPLHGGPEIRAPSNV